MPYVPTASVLHPRASASRTRRRRLSGHAPRGHSRPHRRPPRQGRRRRTRERRRSRRSRASARPRRCRRPRRRRRRGAEPTSSSPRPLSPSWRSPVPTRASCSRAFASTSSFERPAPSSWVSSSSPPSSCVPRRTTPRARGVRSPSSPRASPARSTTSSSSAPRTTTRRLRDSPSVSASLRTSWRAPRAVRRRALRRSRVSSSPRRLGENHGEAQACAFLKLILTDAMTVFSARTRESFVSRRPGGLLVAAFALAAVVACAAARVALG